MKLTARPSCGRKRRADLRADAPEPAAKRPSGAAAIVPAQQQQQEQQQQPHGQQRATCAALPLCGAEPLPDAQLPAPGAAAPEAARNVLLAALSPQRLGQLERQMVHALRLVIAQACCLAGAQWRYYQASWLDQGGPPGGRGELLRHVAMAAQEREVVLGRPARGAGGLVAGDSIGSAGSSYTSMEGDEGAGGAGEAAVQSRCSTPAYT
eukprot:scaffold10.g2288.t1